MPSAELTVVDNFIRVETCGHFMCTCKPQLDDEPMVGYVKIEPGDSDTKITTALHMISDDDHHKVVSVKGVKNQKSVVEAFNGCEAPMITAQGIICGAVYRLER